MNGLLGPPRRLYRRGPGAKGLVVDAEGVNLGPECVLVCRTPSGFRSVGLEEARRLGRFVFDDAGDPDALFRSLAGIARALDHGEMAKAQLLALQIPIGELEPQHLFRLDLLGPMLRKDYNPQEARDRGGKWTAGPDEAGTSEARADDGGARFAQTPDAPTSYADPPTLQPPGGLVGRTPAPLGDIPVGNGPGVPGSLAPPAAGEAGAETAAEVEPAIAIALRALPYIVGVAGGIAVGVLIPSSITPDAGMQRVPGDPELMVQRIGRYLNIFRIGPDGAEHLIYTGLPDADGLFWDPEHRLVARDLGRLGLFVAPVALTKPSDDRPPPGFDLPFDQPRLCPDPSADWPHHSTAYQDAYQTYVTGLPKGLAVWLLGLAYDGCDERDGNMLEAKTGGVWITRVPAYKDMDGYEDIMDQAKRQSEVADLTGRFVEWHFAEKATADFYRSEFMMKGWYNLIVIDDPLPRK